MDVQALLEQFHPYEIDQVATFNVDHLIYILDFLTAAPLRNKKNAEQIIDGFVPMTAHSLQRVVSHYNAYLAYLKRAGVIEVYKNGTFQPGTAELPGKSRKYRFTEAYRQQPIRFVEVTTKAFKRRMSALRSREWRSLRGRDYKHLLKYLEADGRLQIDADAARQWNQERLNLLQLRPELRKVKKRINSAYQRADAYVDPIEQYNHAEYSIGRLEHQIWDVVIDDKVHRLHSPLTNMHSGLRHFLKYDGEELVSLDIANSQPYLATLLLRPGFYSKPDQVLPRLFFEVEGVQIKQERETHQLTHPYLILQNTGFDPDAQDIKTFNNLTSKGLLYQYLQDKFRAQLGVANCGRRQVKETVFEVLFAKNRYTSDRKKLFETLFPSVSQIFIMLKEKDNTMLPRLLQMLESHIVLRRICGLIAKKHPNAPLLTIHDSIVTTLPYAERVETIMKKELERLVGLAPTVKREYWQAATAWAILEEMRKAAHCPVTELSKPKLRTALKKPVAWTSCASEVV
ncbi:S-layer homology domain-containing protein [Hymenobacter cellulosilyticus]|uniref:S-layer homology domain-containing protein n=1 Tax=Hymenobacter cellulosilyticus TaxID=2932248 RepID=A0A8T9QEX6_9BACT|nr:S-layer homology domain-containing protein [Hymenobacter cellulosilyticus]UOQ74119.1 S-layer homology domain-containing protein [Hymenobacter cellulosilyticus]